MSTRKRKFLLSHLEILKAGTVDWLKNLDGDKTDSYPSAVMLSNVSAKKCAGPVLKSPHFEFINNINSSCSFCETPFQLDDIIHVDYNHMLTHAFILTCATCLNTFPSHK